MPEWVLWFVPHYCRTKSVCAARNICLRFGLTTGTKSNTSPDYLCCSSHYRASDCKHGRKCRRLLSKHGKSSKYVIIHIAFVLPFLFVLVILHSFSKPLTINSCSISAITRTSCCSRTDGGERTGGGPALVNQSSERGWGDFEGGESERGWEDVKGRGSERGWEENAPLQQLPMVAVF